MSKRKKRNLVIVFLVVFLLIIASIYIYIQQLNTVVTNMTIGNMEELSSHDAQFIQSYLDANWDTLQFIYDKIQLSECKTLEQVRERLKFECTTSDFDVLYLVDEEGNLYTDTNLVQDASGNVFQDEFEGQGERFVKRADEEKRIAMQNRETLFYGIKSYEFEVDDVCFIGIMGRCRLSSILTKLKIDSFDGRGYGSVIDSDGYFIVNVEHDSSIRNRQNFHAMLKQGELENGMSIEKVQQKIRARENFSIEYKDAKGIRYVITFLPLEDTDWYFLTSVPDSVFQEMNRTFFVMAGIMLLVIVIAMICMAVAAYRFFSRTLEVRAQAQARSDFLSNMSHEIRTPLNGIIGLNHLMMTNLNDREKVAEYLSKTDSTVQYLLKLVNDILDLSKMQTGHVDLKLEPFSLNNMLDDLQLMQQRNVKAKGVWLIVENKISAPWILGDEMRIKQILMNIVSNAVKFTPVSGTITVRVSQEVEEPDRVVTMFEIEDTGCGMSKEFQERIFESFTQERSKISTSIKGTGIGMTISSILVRHMGGSLSVESELGKGSRFTVILPAQIVEAKEERNQEIVSQEEETAVIEGLEEAEKTPNILLVEDNELNAEIMTEILHSVGFSVDHAENGQMAVDLFAASEPGFYRNILMDIQMPVMNGYEATRAIRKLDREDAETVLIYACTANTLPEDQEEALASGMNDFLCKPIDISEILKKLK